jgi:hypothetical protein
LQQILHTNFKLDKDNGSLYLSDVNGVIIDSIHFENQLTDVSYGRLPNGYGAFTSMNTTYNFDNNPTNTIPALTNKTLLSAYPNPASTYLKIQVDGRKNIDIYNSVGQKIISQHVINGTMFSTTNWANGIYILKCGNDYLKVVIQH